MNSHLSEKIISAIRQLCPDPAKRYSLHEPFFCGNEWDYVKECLDSTWVSSVGPYVQQFENKLQDYTSINNAVCVVNGTSALYVCLKLSGVEAGDEVIVPTLTFIATANSVCYCQATPHFADCEPDTLGMDPEKLERHLERCTISKDGHCFNRESGKRISAIIPVHIFGQPARIEEIVKVAKRFQLVVIEDIAESLGSFYQGKHTGSWGTMAALSFNGNKIVTTGGGGAILTNDSKLAQKAKHLTSTAKVPHPWEFFHDEIGFNYRLPNINAALGCAQLEKLPSFLEAKRDLAQRYAQAFEGINDLRVLLELPQAKSNYWLNAIILNKPNRTLRDEILKATNDVGIMTRPLWNLLHTLPMFQTCPRMDLSVARDIENSVVNIPSSASLAQ